MYWWGDDTCVTSMEARGGHPGSSAITSVLVFEQCLSMNLDQEIMSPWDALVSIPVLVVLQYLHLTWMFGSQDSSCLGSQHLTC